VQGDLPTLFVVFIATAAFLAGLCGERLRAEFVRQAWRKVHNVNCRDWRVMAQVSLGEVLSSPDARAYSAINSKRVDLLIVSGHGDPIAAIEYQGHGHYQGNAVLGDAVKKEALGKAGVRYIEVTPESGTEDITQGVLRIAHPGNRTLPCEAQAGMNAAEKKWDDVTTAPRPGDWHGA
jgi:hypothetical protein